MSRGSSSRSPVPRGPFGALVPLGRHAGRPAMGLRRVITVVGSRENAHIRLAGQSVEGAHALIVYSGGRLFIRDLASQTGIRINDEPAIESELLADDQLQMGSFRFRVSVPAGGEGSQEAAEESGSPANLTFEGRGYPLKGHVFLMGRREGADLLLSDPKSSRIHAAIIRANGGYLIRDLGSRAGTLVNGVKVHEQALEPGDLIELAGHEMSFDLESAVAEGVEGAESGIFGANEDSFARGLPGGEEEEDLVALDAEMAAEERSQESEDRSQKGEEEEEIPLASEEPDEPVAPLAPSTGTPGEGEGSGHAALENELVQVEPEPVVEEEEAIPLDLAPEESSSEPVSVQEEGEGVLDREPAAPNPHPGPLPEYRERGKEGEEYRERGEEKTRLASEPAKREGELEEAVFSFGGNQEYHVAGAALEWEEPAWAGEGLVPREREVSLAGVYGEVETERGEVEEMPVAEIPLDQIDRPEEMELEDFPAPPDVHEPQLLGVIRFPPEPDPGEIESREAVEPMASVVEGGEGEASVVELPLETDAPSGARGGEGPDSLHAIKPPPAAYQVTRGLSSLTGGGRAVDIFSQMPVVQEDPVLGRIGPSGGE